MEDGPTPQWPLGDYLRWFTRNVYAHLYGAAGLQASTKMDEFMTGGEASG